MQVSNIKCNNFDCIGVIDGVCLHTVDGYCVYGCDKYKDCRHCKNELEKSIVVCEYNRNR